MKLADPGTFGLQRMLFSSAQRQRIGRPRHFGFQSAAFLAAALLFSNASAAEREDTSGRALLAQTAGNGSSQAPQSAGTSLDFVRVSETTLHGDMECFKIETWAATYFYGKRGAGFASILDHDGHDWISYRPGGKAAGEYRGLPKCGQPTKFFHCGYGFGQYTNGNWFTSALALRERDHARIYSETRDGGSACHWDFFPTRATMTLLRIGQPAYWFIYEGTPGGALDADKDFVVRPGNRKTFLNEAWSDHVSWVYFGAQESPAAFFLIDHQRHAEVDSYVSWPYQREADGSFQQMTVFGFGRPDWKDPKQHTPPLTALPARFSIGFAKTTEYGQVARLIETIRQRVETSRPAP